MGVVRVWSSTWHGVEVWRVGEEQSGSVRRFVWRCEKGDIIVYQILKKLILCSALFQSMVQVT